MNHGNAALDLSDDLDYLFAEDQPDEDFLDDHWLDDARRNRQRILGARRVALNFDDELQREIDRQLDATQELETLEDDDILDLSLAIDDDDLFDLRNVTERPYY